MNVFNPDRQFDRDRILADSFVAQVEYFHETTSTSDVALRMAADGSLRTPALILADRQTAGRGRVANRWWADAGALTFSLVYDPAANDIRPERWPQLSLTTSVALCTSLERAAPAARFGIKWPNDVHVDGRKISGVLIEVARNAVGVAPRLVVGIGVNINNSWHGAPPELRETGTALCDLSRRTHDLTGVLVDLLKEFERRLSQLGRQDPELPALWQKLCVLRGRRVEVESGGRIIAGTCCGTDHDGGLVLQSGAQKVRLFGGTVRSIR